MNEKVKKILKEIIKFALIIIVALNVASYYRSLDLNKEKLDIQSFKLLDGSTHTVEKDKPTLIYFWATWCGVCKIQSPNIQSLTEDYEVITIANQSGNKKQIEQYLKENDFTFKVINDEDGELSEKFNISVFPTVFIYDKDKNLTFSEVGYTSTFGLWLRMWWSS